MVNRRPIHFLKMPRIFLARIFTVAVYPPTNGSKLAVPPQYPPSKNAKIFTPPPVAVSGGVKLYPPTEISLRQTLKVLAYLVFLIYDVEDFSRYLLSLITLLLKVGLVIIPSLPFPCFGFEVSSYDLKPTSFLVRE